MSRNVLVIEDDKDIARLLGLHLKDEGYAVAIVSDGNAGLRQALAKPYDIVILDLILPGMDGLEVCRGIRNRKDYTPVLFTVRVHLQEMTQKLNHSLARHIAAENPLIEGGRV